MTTDREGRVTAAGPVRITEALAGRTVLITGVTGFVGEALLHLLLTEVPQVRIAVVVRDKGSDSSQQRLRALLGKPIFADLVDTAGGADALIAARLRVVTGDLADLPPLPKDLHAVVHCAGDVSFDPPVDAAFATNVVGVRSLLDRVAEVGPHVHYVHISTAYVAGRRRGTIAEAPVEHTVDREAELSWGLAQSQLVEQRSRAADLLEKTRASAERMHGRAGMLTAATAAEARRREWVAAELVRAGAERARSLGWTDCYTFTKALGERVVEAYAGTAPVSIIRPSIIESALERPYPGWIEGFKMAEPLILAYGRGELPEFPAAADTIVDIVPVDHVVSAVVAVLARPPEAGHPQWFHVSSGARRPLTFVRLHTIVRDYFDAHPFEVGDRGAARLPEWRFPGAQAVERLLVTSERAHRAADYLVSHAPRGDRTRDIAQRLGRQQRRLEFLRRYLDLYREYAQADLRFADARTVELFESLHPADRRVFCFDTSVIDWEHYLGKVHCPAVTEPLRELDADRTRRSRSRGTAPRPVGDGNAAAFFDMDGTLLSSNVVETYLWMRMQEMDGADRLGEVGRIAVRLPGLIRAERHDRSVFLRQMYRHYSGARLAHLERIVDEVLAPHVLSRLSPAGVRRVREHRAAGQPTVLITGAIRPLTRPLAPLFDHIEAADLAVDDRGICTGYLDASPLVGESRAAWMQHWADENGVDLSRSFGYADSHSDLPLLAAVGHPVAVRPDISLFRHAKKNHWPVVDWASPPAASRALNPGGAAR
jgi:HAD superfamily hydrolase (TIGR01490 family)